VRISVEISSVPFNSAVGLLAVQNAFDLEVVAVVAEEDAVVLSAQAYQRWGNAVQLFGRAFAGEHVAPQSFENLDRDGPLDAAHVGLGLAGPDDGLGHCFRLAGLRLAVHLLPVRHGEAEFGEDFFMGNGGVVLAPLVRLGNGLGFGGAEGIAVLMEKHFEQIPDRAQLGGRQQIEQGVSLSAFLREIGFHETSLAYHPPRLKPRLQAETRPTDSREGSFMINAVGE